MGLKSYYYSTSVIVVQLENTVSNEIHWVAEAEKRDLD